MRLSLCACTLQKGAHAVKRKYDFFLFHTTEAEVMAEGMGELAVVSLDAHPAACPESLRIDKLRAALSNLHRGSASNNHPAGNTSSYQ